MSLVACRECGHQVSKSARTCPNCGVKNPWGKTRWWVWVVGLLFGFWVFSFAFQAQNAAQRTAATPAATSARQPAQPAPPPAPEVEIQSMKWYQDPEFAGRGAVVWTVVLESNATRYIQSVQVEFTTYDADGKVMDVDTTYVTGLSPGGTASGKGYATYFGQEARATVRVVRLR